MTVYGFKYVTTNNLSICFKTINPVTITFILKLWLFLKPMPRTNFPSPVPERFLLGNKLWVKPREKVGKNYEKLWVVTAYHSHKTISTEIREKSVFTFSTKV